MNAHTITLRSFGPEDFQRLKGWIDSYPALVQWGGPKQFTFPLDDEQLIQYYKEGLGPRSMRRIFVAQNSEGEPVGHSELALIDYEKKTASLCRVLIAPEMRGRGYALPMVNAVLDVAFKELEFLHIELRVYSFNAPAIKCYERAGFKLISEVKQSTRVGEELWDTHTMAVDNPEQTPSGAGT